MTWKRSTAADAGGVADPFTLGGGFALLWVCAASLFALTASIAEMARGEFADGQRAFALLEAIGAIACGWSWLKRYRVWRQARRKSAGVKRTIGAEDRLGEQVP